MLSNDEELSSDPETARQQIKYRKKPSKKLSKEEEFHKSVKSRNGYFIENTEFADMKFYIEDENLEIPAHRVIVSSASIVLSKLITGTGNIKPSDKITVSDTSSNDFRQILKYIYTDEINITTDNAIAILRIANYFDLRYIEELCVDLLLLNLTIDNVCTKFSIAYKLNKRFADKCLHLIRSTTDLLLKNGAILEMDMDAICEVLNSDHLNIKHEKDIFDILLRLANKQCKKNNLPPTSLNRRKILGEKYKLVRFNAMNISEFFDCLNLDPAFLSKDEISEISTAIKIGNKCKTTINQKFNSNIRRTPPTPTILTFQLFHWTSNGVNFRNFPPEQFNIKATAPVLIHGFGMYGRKSLRIHNSDDKKLAIVQQVYDRESEMSKLMLEKPIVMKTEQTQCFTAYHDQSYGKCFYFYPAELKNLPSVFFTHERKNVARVVHIYYQDLIY